jgi:ABC-2 type transport system permease protein
MMFVIFFFPVFLLIIFGYAVNFDVENIKIAVYDQSGSRESRRFVHSISETYNFIWVKDLNSYREVDDVIDRKEVQAVVVIPADFEDDLNNPDGTPDIQFIIDGVDGNSAAIISNYLNAAVLKYSNDLMRIEGLRNGIRLQIPLYVESRFWFNPVLETTKFLLPGLIAMILIVTAVVSVSLSLVREKERGTMEQINVSSINNIELLVGKSLPYILISLVNGALILVAGYLLFDIEIKGSIFWLFISMLIFIVASICLGILISVISPSQQIAFSLATFASLLPSVIFSGFIFPIDSMPYIIQIITNITPAKFFIASLRGIVLKGSGLYAFYDQLIYLLLFALVFITLAFIASKKSSGGLHGNN